MLRRMLNPWRWGSVAAARSGVMPMVAPVVAGLVLAVSTAYADDAGTRPQRPSELTVAGDAETLAYMAAWAALEGATSYRVRWRLKGADFREGDEISVETNRAIFRLSEPGVWVVRLEACNAAGCGPGLARTVAIRPSRPGNLALRAAPGVLTLAATWEAAGGVSSYKVRWRRPDGAFASGDEAVVTAPSASFSVSDYGWWVVRVEGCNASDCGPSVNAATAIIPSAPANLAVRATPGALKLAATWDAAAGATSYVVRWRRPDGAFATANEAVVTTASASFSVSGYGRWKLRVEGCYGTDCGAPATGTVTILPGDAQNLAVGTAPGIYQLRATWDTVAGASSYRLRWRQPGEDFAARNEINTEARESTFAVSGPGRWVIRLEGCGEDGCGRGASVTVSVAALSPAVWLPVCERTPAVRDALVRIVEKSCDEITAADLSPILYLSVRNKGAGSVKTGDFSGLPRLGALDLEGNALTALPADVFGGLGNLRHLYLNDNALTALPEGLLDGLVQLAELYLQGNALTTLPANVLDGLAKLKDIHLQDNGLTILPESVFEGLTSLSHLDLSGNALAALPADVFDGLDVLTKLHLDDNALTALPAGVFEGLGVLAYLYLSNNDLTALPGEVFDGLGALTYLYLGGNDLTALPEDVFSGVAGKLVHLHLRNNALGALPEAVFDGMNRLDQLALDGNALAALPEDVFDGLVSLAALDLGGNELTALPETVFDGPAALWSLDLGDNALAALPGDVFDGLVRLAWLLLDGNELMTLPDGVFDDLGNLVTLDLTGNPGAPFDVDLGSEVDVRQ